ncbi:hypothetical protein AJ79_06966 [Helicocarpus griseus UAMH5409]|uniref:Rhodopsin domain-containing protein n=1 Tax=Helicocarpus griseus UAMH5409 TaxID=1447875 RepID=A0A2B7X7Y0_9EURO|nr:hypothetical protein AJ79_06966 [Helicocarpus griseus UAMH5409]
MEQPPGVPTIPDTNYAPYYLISTGILGAIGVILCCLRAYTKLRPSPHLTADDYLIIVAVAIDCHLASQTESEQAVEVVSVGLNCGSTATFHRLVDCPVRLVPATPVELATITARGGMLGFQTSNQLWLGYCCGDINAAIFTFMDLVFALMPIKLVWQLQRSIREKILISCLMAMGLLATASVCVKMTTFTKVGQGDPLSSTVYPSFLAKLEEVLGIIAACMPCLKSPAERLLRRIGVLSERYVNTLTRPSFVVSHNQAPKDYTVSPQNGNPRKNWRTSVDDVELEEQPPSRSSSFTRINHLDSTGKSDWNSSIATATTTNPASPADNQASSGSASGPTGTSARGWEAV